MDTIIQTTSHPGLRAWFELLRTSRDGLMPKYWVGQGQRTIHCSYPECVSLTIRRLASRNWGLRRIETTGHLYAFRHDESCSWCKYVDIDSQTSFTSQPLERAYVYWAQFEHKTNRLLEGSGS
jgi:hypothetical protein